MTKPLGHFTSNDKILIIIDESQILISVRNWLHQHKLLPEQGVNQHQYTTVYQYATQCILGTLAQSLRERPRRPGPTQLGRLDPVCRHAPDRLTHAHPRRSSRRPRRASAPPSSPSYSHPGPQLPSPWRATHPPPAACLRPTLMLRASRGYIYRTSDANRACHAGEEG